MDGIGWMGLAIERRESIESIDKIISNIYWEMFHTNPKDFTEETKERFLQQLGIIINIIDGTINTF